jgi:AcrR family transcriptional regulator
LEVRRGRPRAYDPEKALSQALALFWDQGFAATSLDALSAATGMNRPSLYGAFGDKRALYLKALELYTVNAVAAIEKALAAPSLREGLERFYCAARRLHVSGEAGQRGCLLVGTAAVESVNDPDIRASLNDALARFDALIEARLRRARAEGELAEGADIGGLAKVVSAGLYASAVRARAGDPPELLQAMTDAVIGLICGKAQVATG